MGYKKYLNVQAVIVGMSAKIIKVRCRNMGAHIRFQAGSFRNLILMSRGYNVLLSIFDYSQRTGSLQHFLLPHNNRVSRTTHMCKHSEKMYKKMTYFDVKRKWKKKIMENLSTKVRCEEIHRSPSVGAREVGDVQPRKPLELFILNKLLLHRISSCKL